MRHRAKERIALLVEIALVAGALIAVGYSNQIVWKFDAAIIGSFLFGDYALRWVFRLRRRRWVLAFVGLFQKPNRARPWLRLALAAGVFFIVVMVLGEVAFLGSIILGFLYSGKLPIGVVGLVSVALSLWLSTDFRDNYKRELGAYDDFWENNVP